MAKQPDILKIFGNNLRKYRLEKGWTQKDLAFYVNKEPTYISKMELGKANLSLEYIAVLANVLECKPADLLKY